MPLEPTPRLMLDYSVLLTPGGGELADEAAGLEVPLVVSNRLASALAEGEPLPPVRPVAGGELDPFFEEQALRGIQSGRLQPFSFEEAELEGDARAVLEAILESGGPVAEIDADQWAFLNSSSWLGANDWRPLKAFVDAGAFALEAGKKVGMKMLGQVIPPEKIPPNVSPQLIARGVVKWVAVGGMTVGGGTLGGLVGALSGDPTVATVAAKAGGYAGSSMSRAAFLAIDP